MAKTFRVFWGVLVIAFYWSGKRVRESKWYIIPLAIDIILIPAKIVIFAILAMISKRFRTWMDEMFDEIIEDALEG